MKHQYGGALSLAIATCLTAGLAPPVRGFPSATQGASEAPYKSLFNKREEYTNFNVETTRAMTLIGTDLFALNTHSSRLARLDLTTFPPVRSDWPTALNPVALGQWNGKLLVLGGSSYALFVHDATTGVVEQVVDLQALAPEPGDLLVEPGGSRAWISSMGANRVVRLDLTSMTVDGSWDVPSLRPRFLSHVPALAGSPWPDRIHVTPMLSGNNSTIAVNDEFEEMDATIIDLDTAAVGGADLPDEDLFAISVDAVDGLPPGGGGFDPVVRRLGTILTGHGRNPEDDRYWVLSVDLHNKGGADFDSEPELRGIFASNELVIFPAPASLAGGPLDAKDHPAVDRIPLDDSPSGQEDDVVSNPWDLLFLPEIPGVSAAVSSPTGDVVRFLDKFGNRVGEAKLAAGAIPRGMATYRLPSGATFLLVHCWGNSTIEVVPLTPGPLGTSAVQVMDLGLDPTPESVAAGRELFYDAHLSMGAKTTCGTCHVGGEYDGLAWPIGDDPVDYKDVMVTQNLKSIEDTFPYHWRGERGFEDFNGAFVGLLGGSRTLETGAGQELEQFEDFVFSMQKHANPHQDLSRLVVGESAVRGQEFFTDPENITVGVFNCATCHAGPAGSNGEFVQNAGEIATKMHFEVAHLRDLGWKDSPSVEVNYIDPYQNGAAVQASRNRLGFGVLHNGRFANIAELLVGFQEATLENLAIEDDMPDAERDDITAFLRQFDTGLAPAAHNAVHLPYTDSSEPSQMQLLAERTAQVELLIDQVEAGWCGLMAFGRFTIGSTEETLFFAYDADGNGFDWSRPSGVLPPLQALVDQVSAGNATVVFMGTPAGNAQKLALDIDRDGLDHVDEVLGGTDLQLADTDGDGWSDGHEALNGSDPGSDQSEPTDLTAPVVTKAELVRVNVNQAVLHVETDEPSRFEVRWYPVNDVSGSGAFDRFMTTTGFSREETLVLHGLVPASRYFEGDVEEQEHIAEIIAIDEQGNPSLVSTVHGIYPIVIQDGPPEQLNPDPEASPQRSVGIVSELCFEGDPQLVSNVLEGTTTMSATVSARVLWQGGQLGDFVLPPGSDSVIALQNWRLVAQVLVLDANTGRWVPSEFNAGTAPVDFAVNGLPWSTLGEGGTQPPIPGPVMVSPLTSSVDLANPPNPLFADAGYTQMSFSVDLVAPTQPVKFNVIAVAREEGVGLQPPPDPNLPELTVLAGWIFQGTAGGVRELNFNSMMSSAELSMCPEPE